MNKTSPFAALAALAVVAASVIVASPASAVTTTYSNPLATAATSDRDITSLDVAYNTDTISVTAHTQNIPPYYIFGVYFAQNPGSFYSGAMESAQLSVQGTTQTNLYTYNDGQVVTTGDGSLVSWNRSGDAFTITVPSSVIPWGGAVYASAVMLLTDQSELDFHYAATAVDQSSGALSGFGPIAKGQLATSVSLASTGSTQKHGKSYITYFATVSPATVPGAVQFFEGTTLLAIVQQSGGASSFAAPSLGLGTHAIHAVFVPSDGNYTPSSSAAVNVKVISSGKATKTKISLSSHTQHYKKKGVRVSVKVTSTKATGTVVLYSGTTKLATATLKKGRAHFTVRKTLTKGTKKITVKYVPKNIDAYKTSRSPVAKLKVVK